ncbi:IS21 family transposase, partial [Anoxynatronum sibiricum]
MIVDVDLYGQIRHMFTQEGMTQRAISRTLGISRNTVKKYCEGNYVPWERKPYERISSVVTEEIRAFIQECLDQDEAEGLKKQSHTA